jgi:RNA polymerase sigma-70 factor (ECF subfamily)
MSCTTKIPNRKTTTAAYADWTDEALLLEYRQYQDRPAFEHLVKRYERELYNYLRHYMSDAEMAEDAFQTTFLQVHLKCDQFEEGRKFRPWLYRIATNQAIDAQRKRKRRRMYSLDGGMHSGSNDPETPQLLQLLENEQDDPFEILEEAERAQQVRDAIDRLPGVLGETLKLVYFQGLKYREVAEVLSVPFGTVKSRLNAAIKKLNLYLSEEGAETYSA